MKTRKSTFDIYLPATPDREARYVETIDVEVYDNFGEEFLTTESSELIERTRIRHLGLMHGDDLKTLRARLNLTQNQLSDLLSCGKKSLSRWENGRGYPSGLVNTLLRLLDESLVTVNDLKTVSGSRRKISPSPFLEKRRNNVIACDFKNISKRDVETWTAENVHLAPLAQ